MLIAYRSFKARLLPFMLMGLITACGGSGGGDSGGAVWTMNPGGASSYSAVATNFQGPISGLGSIVVNGVRFETTDATIYDPDDFSDNTLYGSPLAMGMTVALMGDADEAQSLGRATRIRVVGGARGTLTPSTDIDLTAKTIALPTQTIAYSDTTVFSGTAGVNSIASASQLQALTTPVLLNIYGLVQADNSFLATRVVLVDAANYSLDVAVRGKISAISTSSYTVSTGSATSITVDCSTCTIQPSGSTPVVGDIVRVLATDSSNFNAGVLSATRMQLITAYNLARFNGVTSGFAKVKGVATTDGSNNWFIGGVQVTGATSLVQGTFYEAKGTWSGSILQVSQVEVEGHSTHLDGSGSSHHYNNELYGAVSQLSGSTFMVQGVTVDASSAYFQNGTISNLTNTAFVEVKGNLNASGILVATKIEFKTASSGSLAGMGRSFEVHGTISQWTGTRAVFTFTNAGASMTAQTSSSTRYKNNILPNNGSRAELKGYMDSTGVFQVLKMEVENIGGYHEYD